jgi:16S rRNA (adenine1518-N6/adenine1519-N6)-dimethyltransferase
VRPRKRFGQHFLEPVWVRKLLASAAPRPEDVFLEIGSGRGAVTIPLAHLVRRVVAIEIDRDLAERLARTAPENVQVVTADFLKCDLGSLFRGVASRVRVVGNLPYNISSPILFHLLAVADEGRFLADATLMLQREVADRIVAGHGHADYGVLSVMVQFLARVERLLLLPPGAFRPPPRVSSAVVHLTFTPPTVTVVDRHLLEQMVRAMFTHRRKTVGNALRDFARDRRLQASETLANAGIEPSRRPETLDLSELARLADVFASVTRPDVL